ncbi:MAG: hypothetical protein PHS93_08245 [Candidatus Omnitrophica bacterium]|nr:hypothetical protein [Candidatus Omnitrophota bacterium]MDD5589122.1 hypothetical protein [Candidatus Nanoarchaeia archaeon]
MNEKNEERKLEFKINIDLLTNNTQFFINSSPAEFKYFIVAKTPNGVEINFSDHNNMDVLKSIKNKLDIKITGEKK